MFPILSAYRRTALGGAVMAARTQARRHGAATVLQRRGRRVGGETLLLSVFEKETAFLQTVCARMRSERSFLPDGRFFMGGARGR